MILGVWAVKCRYLLQETWLGLRRGGWMNGAAVSTIAVLLFLLGSSLQVSWQMDNLMMQLGSQLEISVYLRKEAKPDQLQPLVANMAGVSAVRIITKDQAWRSLLADLGSSDLAEATALLGANPLSDELKVKVKSQDDLTTIAAQLKKLSGVEAVWLLSGVVEGLRQLRWTLGTLGVGLVSGCCAVAIAVITITIQLVMIARRCEIEVLQLVGATKRWIAVPFLLQGLTYGAIGAITALAVLKACAYSLGSNLHSQPELVQMLLSEIFSDQRSTWLLPPILLGFGALVGMAGSWLAIKHIHSSC